LNYLINPKIVYYTRGSRMSFNFIAILSYKTR